ncbi:hypothetical protein [Nocardioides okcheonensis]|uniref:hypothetical protein n=1 Tax=Nocardioides okcheonensis TaxID=2894081 RepID=UPI001E4171D3|nr:hypothetical protein [Nocardioides okcheonensis]UFN44518.1 hypothetical protein LN652_21155 [Nocardioides okcheonensis]
MRARIVARYQRPEYVVLVDDPAGEVRVRWSLGRSRAWRCDTCGPMTTTDCPHVFAAGLLLAEEFLGLTRHTDLRPNEGTTP